MQRRPSTVAMLVGAALVAAAIAIAILSDGEEAHTIPGPMQVGGTEPGDLTRGASTPSLAVDPGDPSRMLLANRVETPSFGCEVHLSEDGGASWRRSKVRLPRKGDSCYAPSVAFDEGGTAHLLLAMLEGRGNEPVGNYLYSSRDLARFNRPRQALPAASFQTSLLVDEEGGLRLSWLAGSEYNEHATFGLGPPPNPVSTARVPPGSRDPEKPVRVSGMSPSKRYGGPVSQVGPQGQTYVLYWDWGGDFFDYHAFPGRYRGHFRLILAEVPADGGPVNERVAVDPVAPSRPFLVYLPPLPALAVNPEDGSLVAAWEDARSGSSDVLLTSSEDGGQSWSEPRVLFGDRANEHTPALSFDSEGGLAALAYREGRSGRTEVALRRSPDGGGSFGPAVALGGPFDSDLVPTNPGRRELPFLGSSIGLTEAGEGGLLAAWAEATGTRKTQKVDIMLRPLPPGAGEAAPLPPAPPVGPAQPSRADVKLKGECVEQPPTDSQEDGLQLVRSFFNALADDPERAYGYMGKLWTEGRPPARTPHTFADFRRRYGEIECAELLEAVSYDRSEDGVWDTVRAWVAVRAPDGKDELMVANVWTRSETAEPPFEIVGLATKVLGSD